MKKVKQVLYWIGLFLLFWGLFHLGSHMFTWSFEFGPLITELPLEERSLKLIEYEYFRIDNIYIPLLIGVLLVMNGGERKM